MSKRIHGHYIIGSVSVHPSAVCVADVESYRLVY